MNHSLLRRSPIVSIRCLIACLTLFPALTLSTRALPNAGADEPTPTVPADTTILFAKPADFDQWKGDTNYWSVQDGVIVGENPASRPLPAHTYLIFQGGEFEDFELTAQFKIEGEGGNSGIQYRGKVVDGEKFKVAGYQADIDFNNRYAGILYEQDGRGIVALRGESVTVEADGERIRKRFGDATQLGKGIHPGQWNDYRIVAKGNTLEHYINGALTARVVDEQTEKSSSKGVIALQLHRGPPMTVRYKNIILRKP